MPIQKIVCFIPLRHLFFFKKVKCPIIIDKNNFKKIILIKRRLKKKNEAIYTNFQTANLNDWIDIKFNDENNIKIYE